MFRQPRWLSVATATAVATSLATLAGCESAPAPPNTLLAVKVASAPDITRLDADPVWSRAPALPLKLTEGVNFAGGKGETQGLLKAAYTADMIYILVQYQDATPSIRRSPYQKQADGSWRQLRDPNNRGGDDNVYDEDKWAFLWPVGEVKDFDRQGCAVACHLGQGKPYGSKSTRNEGEILDMWRLSAARTAPLGFVDDLYVDATRHDPQRAPNAGRKADPGGPDHTPIALENRRPRFMHRSGLAANARGGQYFIAKGDEVPLDDSRFKPGDEVAGHISLPLQGDRADIRVHLAWKNGLLTAVMSRKLVTGSRFDVQWADLNQRYAFGFAAFDNAQVRHATADTVFYLQFGK